VVAMLSAGVKKPPGGSRAAGVARMPPVLNQRLRGAWDKFVRPVGGAVGRIGISANAITVAGVLVQAGAAYLIVRGSLVAAGLVTAAAGAADLLDGAVAKARGEATRFGALLDSTTDRLSDALFFVAVAWLYGVDPDVASHDDPWVAAAALAALVFTFLVSYVKARAESLGFECNVGFAERFERVALMIVGLVFGIVPVMVLVLLAVSAFTFVQRMVHVSGQARGAAPRSSEKRGR
jgi:CDP-diacylglycerol--glycerol-3-phosphate 3-phosphatidyltransferase